MTTAELIDDLRQRGIRLEAHGDKLRYSPRDAVTGDLLAMLQAHKGDLLAMLQAEVPKDTPTAHAEAQYGHRDDEDAEAIDAAEMPPCPACGRLEMWQAAASDLSGLTPGRWRCLRCDPPTTSRRLLDLAARSRP